MPLTFQVSDYSALLFDALLTSRNVLFQGRAKCLVLRKIVFLLISNLSNRSRSAASSVASSCSSSCMMFRSNVVTSLTVKADSLVGTALYAP